MLARSNRFEVWRQPSGLKTIADAFKFRNKIALGGAVEALRAYSKRKNRQFDHVGEFAEACRVQNIDLLAKTSNDLNFIKKVVSEICAT